jgi:NAD(P)-dependent dehydrogenase (short-subunit alcohol dehydrogenase family)
MPDARTDQPATETDPARTVLITGAAGGLGRAFALGFAAQGDRVVVADTNLEGAQQTAALIEAAGGAAFALQANVTQLDSVTRLAADAAAFAAASATGGTGQINVIINNAAIYATITRSPFEEIDVDEWDRVMAVNLKGPWLVTRACSPYLANGAAVINLSSATVLSGSAQWAHYVASKGGVIALTRVLAKELGDRNVTVNAIAPGFTLTEASYGLIEGAAEYGVD